MNELQTKMLAFLDETVAHYSENTLRRCKGDFLCYYNPLDADPDRQGISQGCAIGRKMSDEQKTLARNVVMSVKKLSEQRPNLIPTSLEGMPVPFLSQVQALHDTQDYWVEGIGLSERGRECVVDIKDSITRNLF